MTFRSAVQTVLGMPGTQATGLISRYGYIQVGGADASAFLQSQLAADISLLGPEETVLTGWHDRKGRVLACLRVVRKVDGYWLVMPATLIDATLAGLQIYVLRSQVTLTDRSTELIAAGVIDADGGRYEIYADAQQLAERVAAHHADGVRQLRAREWELQDIRAGTPEVYPATRGTFTGQMLNLDLIGGISFNKGCYPGQEVIARTHHLGRAKRRMQRYVCDGPALAPGDSLDDDQGKRGGTVVRSAAAETGSESLVVTSAASPARLFTADGDALDPADLPYSLT